MNFSVFFTNRCNMNCSYCYEKNKKECSMSYEIIDKTIDFIVSKKHENPTEKLSIVTHGGDTTYA
ncbi:4Fe-4S cluster-binding domain-containing protein [Lachnospiraceae bacterium]|nr:4Fe-4S cluster-binding domain-containing protein [uncultured Acetatifactor sp.]NBH29133.1 4Fe-4S cluster-binding domain-containing protein [Lachnospiraceae bacterium]